MGILQLLFFFGSTLLSAVQALVGAIARVEASLWLLILISNHLASIAIAAFYSALNPQLIPFSYTKLDNPIIAIGFKITQSFVNMALVLALIWVALNIALRLTQETEAKKMLVRLILIALLVNFAPVICGLVVDAANIIMEEFASRIRAAPGVGNIFLFQSAKAMHALEWVIGPGEIGLVAWIIIFNSLVALVFFMAAGILIIRHLAIWILVIFAPLAFVAYIIPQAEKYWKMWRDTFLNWAFVVVPMLFLIYLALYFTYLLTAGAIPGVVSEGKLPAFQNSSVYSLTTPTPFANQENHFEKKLANIPDSPTYSLTASDKNPGEETPQKPPSIERLLPPLADLLTYTIPLLFLFLAFQVGKKSTAWGVSLAVGLVGEYLGKGIKWGQKQGWSTLKSKTKSLSQRAVAIPEIGAISRRLERTPVVGRIIGGPGMTERLMMERRKAVKEKLEKIPDTEEGNKALLARITRRALTLQNREERDAAIEILAQRKALTNEVIPYLPQFQQRGGDTKVVTKARPSFAQYFIDSRTGRPKGVAGIREAISKTSPADLVKNIQEEDLRNRRVAYLIAKDRRMVTQLGRQGTKAQKEAFRNTLLTTAWQPGLRNQIREALNIVSTDPNWRF